MSTSLSLSVNNQKGIVNTPILVLLAAAGIIAFLLLTQFASFKSKTESSLYPKKESSAAQSQTGSGAPSGAHYNLNLIGVPRNKTANMTGDNGRRIFVPLVGNCKINLSPGDFQVLDANCTDGPSAFQLPNPDPNNDGITEYSVYARALGRPSGSSTTTTCATDPTTGEVWCSVYSMVLVREKGKSSFSNVSNILLYAYVDLDGDGNVERYPLFDDRLQDYYWNYDNNGLKLVQLRFYQISTNVNP